MDIQRQYIVQSIVNAANNLRLSTEKIEVVALLREHFSRCEELETEIGRLKKKTEFSKFAVKLGELYNFISKNNLDLLKLSDNLKEHIHYIVKELSNLLDVLTPIKTREILEDKVQKKVEVIEVPQNIDMNILNKIGVEDEEAEESFAVEMPSKSESDELKEDYILSDLNKNSGFSFENYEEAIMKPVKELDQFLRKIKVYEYSQSEYESFIKKMRTNADLSSTMGFEIIAQMHVVFARGLELLRDGMISLNDSVIEGLRSCLIVIVAVVRGKDVDITTYLNRAEVFGKKLMSSKFN